MAHDEESSPRAADRMRRSAPLIVVAALCFIAALLTPFVVFGVWQTGAGVGLTGLFTTLGLWCLRFAKQAGLRGAAPTLAEDPRRPVVYLRAFRVDSFKSRLKDWRYAYAPWQRGYFEQFGAGGFAFDVMLRPAIEERIGPLIALGKPGDRLAPFGAARLYQHQADWQDAVRDLIKRAAAILVLGIESEGVLWELKTIRAESNPDRLFILTHPSRRAHQAADWRALVERTREIGLFFPLADPGSGAVLAFDAGWTARAICRDAPTAEAYANAIDQSLRQEPTGSPDSPELQRRSRFRGSGLNT